MSDTCSIYGTGSEMKDESRFDPGPGKHLVFFGDPMCSWCWGFAPVLERVHEYLHERVGSAELHVVMGGLRPGTREPWDDKLRDYIADHWRHVQNATGQPFDFTRFDDETFIYDTEPACRAVVAARALAPERTLAVYHAVQRAFHAEGGDVTDAGVLADIAHSQGLDRDAFAALFAGAEAADLLAFDFRRTRAFGVTGFPTLLCAEDGQYGYLALGYRPFDALAPLLEEWLNA